MTKARKLILLKRLQDSEYLSDDEKCQYAMLFNTSEKTVEYWFTQMSQKKQTEGTLSQSE